MSKTKNVFIDQIARAAGYIMMPLFAEAGARDIRRMYPNDEAKGREQVRAGVKMGSGGIVLSDDELTRFIGGASIRSILANRLTQAGDVKQPYITQQVADDPDSAIEEAILEGRLSDTEIDRVIKE